MRLGHEQHLAYSEPNQALSDCREAASAECACIKRCRGGTGNPTCPTPAMALDTIAEAGAGEAAEWYLISHYLAAKSVQLRLARQRVAMAAQKAQATGQRPGGGCAVPCEGG
jgi:hypothetical protein